MKTHPHAEAFSGITAADLDALNFFYPPFGDGCVIAQIGDYWLTLTPQSAGTAMASLVLDEDELFAVEVPDSVGLRAAHARALACIAEQAERAETEDFQALLDRQGLGHLFE